MRVVDTDNFGGDYPNEKFITVELSKEICERIAEAENKHRGEHSSRYWKVVQNDYTLVPGFEP